MAAYLHRFTSFRIAPVRQVAVAMNGVVAAALELIGDGRLARSRQAFDQVVLPTHVLEHPHQTRAVRHLRLERGNDRFVVVVRDRRRTIRFVSGTPMDDTDRTIVALCRLPIDFRSLGNVSAVDLVVRSGYPAVTSQVPADRAHRCLAVHPDWVDAWFVWSDDQRSSPAWWLSETSATSYEVGYHDPKRERQESPLVFDDRVRACAEFMVRAIESIEASRLRVEAIRMPGESYLAAAVRLSHSRTS